MTKAVGPLTSKLAEVDLLVQRVNVLQETVRGLESKLLVVQNTTESALLKSNDNEHIQGNTIYDSLVLKSRKTKIVSI